MNAVARVCELAEQVRGVTYRKADASPVARPGYLPVLRAGNITDDGLTFGDLVYVPAERIAEKQKIRRNDILIAASSGSLRIVGKAARALDDYEAGFGAFCKVLRPGPDVDPAYFAHFFRTRHYRQRVSELAAGVSINNLRNEHLDQLQIPVPAPTEQQRIASILDAAHALHAKRTSTLACLDVLLESTFVDLFRDPARSPLGWTKRDFNATMRDETSRSKRLPRSAFLSKGRFPVIDQGQNSIAGYYDDPSFLCQSTLPVVVFGDHTRVVKLVREPFIIGADGAKVLVAKPGVETDFLAWLLRTTRIPNLGYSRHMREVKRLVFDIPPLDLQLEFARRVGLIDKQRGALERSRVAMNELSMALQHRAFRGEL